MFFGINKEFEGNQQKICKTTVINLRKGGGGGGSVSVQIESSGSEIPAENLIKMSDQMN